MTGFLERMICIDKVMLIRFNKDDNENFMKDNHKELYCGELESFVLKNNSR